MSKKMQKPDIRIQPRTLLRWENVDDALKLRGEERSDEQRVVSLYGMVRSEATN